MRFCSKILVVDDSKFVNNAIKSELLERGFKDSVIFQAFTLDEAKVILEQNRVDFVMLDLILPDGEGEELISEFSSKDLKIIVLTSDSDKARRENLFRLGVLDYFSKDNPIKFTVNETVKLIEKYFQNREIKILVVDDSSFSRNYMRDIFLNRNYQVICSKNGKEAIEILYRESIDLLVLDLEMPIMSGEKVIHHIRQKDKFLNLPIIVLSGTSNDNLIAKVLKNGANDFIKKPFSIEELTLKSDIFISLGRTQRELIYLNSTLELKVKEEIEKNREKDRVLEFQSRQAQMGEMINSIAHQWKQPLNILSIMAMELRFDYETKGIDIDILDEYIDKVMMQVRYMTNTIDDFRNFFKPNLNPKKFSILDSINSVLNLVGRQYESDDLNISITGDRKIEILGFKNEFEQVIINILNNSRDAMIERNIENRDIEISISSKDRVAVLEIVDFAGGIDSAIVEKVFEPYVSTKGESGTGIGLYMSKVILQKIGADISLESVDNGVKFTILTPLID